MGDGVGTTREATPASRRAAVWIGIVITAAFLYGGFLVKDRCAKNLGWEGWQYSSNCYSDITALYTNRELHKNHPIAYRDADLEYPALTGLFITVVNAPVSPGCDGGGLCGTRGFFLANVLALAPFGLLGAGALAAIATRRRRILYYAAAPAVLAYAFHNWDLIPVGLTAAAMWALTKRRDGGAGILLGLGAAAKLYPAFIVPVFMAARWKFPPDPTFATFLSVSRSPGERLRRAPQWLRALFSRSGEEVRRALEWVRALLSRPWVRVFVGAAAGFILPNLIVFLLAGLDGWWHPWQFQGKRFPNFETSWFFIYRHLGSGGGSFWVETYPKIAQWGSTVIFLAGGAALLWRELRRERFRPFVAATGMVLLFLITAKVYSPQFALWLLPFFVVVGIPWWGYGLFVVSDLFVLSAIWWYLTARGYPGQIVNLPPGVPCEAFPACVAETEKRLNFLEAAVWFRYAALLALLWVSRRAPEHASGSETPSTEAAALPV